MTSSLNTFLLYFAGNTMCSSNCVLLWLFFICFSTHLVYPEASLRGILRLNVVENWNSANNFIFFGNGRELSSNQLENQELSVLSLHLLQNCLIYINTLMIQKVLASNEWISRLTVEDYRALSPLIYAHINPYGNFVLDMNSRIPLEEKIAA